MGTPSAAAAQISRPTHGGRISRVRSGSTAERVGLRAGDVLLAVNGLVPRDLIDLQFSLIEPSVVIDVERSVERLRIDLDAVPSTDLGVEFDEAVFSGIRECVNHCEFCFIRGLPPGLRPSLYVYDDDFRYSFLYGNFLTLTNLGEEDWQRISYQRLTPLWVSVHATDVNVRNRMLVNSRAPAILPQLYRLGQLGIQVHAQVVLCPGINDGPVLKETIRALADLSNVVLDVAVVPVGLTDSSRVRNIRRNTSQEARAALRIVHAAQAELKTRMGRRFVYASDELYLQARARLPAAAAYDGYPHLFNGVGLTRYLLASWSKERRRVPSALSTPRRVVWLCGTAAASALRHIAAEVANVGNLSLEVRVVENSLFGPGIAVSGLLPGQDILRELGSIEADTVVLPAAAFGFGQGRTIDDVTLHEIIEATPGRIALGATAGDLVESLLEPG